MIQARHQMVRNYGKCSTRPFLALARDCPTFWAIFDFFQNFRTQRACVTHNDVFVSKSELHHFGNRRRISRRSLTVFGTTRPRRKRNRVSGHESPKMATNTAGTKNRLELSRTKYEPRPKMTTIIVVLRVRRYRRTSRIRIRRRPD